MSAAVCPRCGRLIRAHTPGAHPVVGLVDHVDRCRADRPERVKR